MQFAIGCDNADQRAAPLVAALRQPLCSAFFVGVLYFLAQVKTTERASYPVYFETAEKGHYRFKAPAALTAIQLRNRELHFATPSSLPAQKLPANTVVAGSAVEVYAAPARCRNAGEC